jgi:uncharacterized integral membrane protein (TIGR02327 family)
MPDLLLRIVLHLASFAIALYALEGIDFARFIRKGRTTQATILLFLLSMALGYLVAQFLLMLAYRYYF